jgi:glycosyltransferase involved in cell wall biosynthesis
MVTPAPLLDLDGWQLQFPHTGLGNVTANLIKAWTAQDRATRVRIFVPAGVNLAEWDLEGVPARWIFLSRPSTRTDYLSRWRWSRQLVRARGPEAQAGRLFVPYLYNHLGIARQATVLVPDLVYRLIPFADFAAAPWWHLRRRFYLRRLVMRAEERLVTRARAWITFSRFVSDHATAVLRLDPTRVVTSTLGPGPQFRRDGPTPAELGIADLPAHYALYAGGYGFRKNIRLLLDACAAAARTAPDFRCVCVGAAGRQLAVGHGVHTLPPVSDVQLAALYRHSRFCLLPSRAEGFGLPLVEAAACGRVTLVADNTSLREIQPDPSLRLVEQDPAAWAHRALRLWNDGAWRRELEANLPALLAGRTNERFADDVWNLATQPPL